MANSLDRLTIKGFKSIRTLNDFELQNLNIFIGANGAGKSNLLDFFRLLRSVINGNLNEYIRNSGTIHTGGNLTGSEPITNAASVDLPAEVSNLLAQVIQAGQQGLLDKLTTIDVESGLRKALALLRKPHPDHQAVLANLTTAQATITAAAQRGNEVGAVLGTLTHVIVLIRH